MGKRRAITRKEFLPNLVTISWRMYLIDSPEGGIAAAVMIKKMNTTA
jgi:hypothetical protein